MSRMECFSGSTGCSGTVGIQLATQRFSAAGEGGRNALMILHVKTVRAKLNR